MAVIHPGGGSGHYKPRLSGKPSPVGDWIGKAFLVVWNGVIFTFLGLILISLIASGATYVVVDLIAGKTGLLDAWAGLVSITVTEATAAAPIGEGVMFGAAAGILIGIARFLRRWQKHRHRWVVEALVSPEGAAALRYGLACVGLNVLIGVLSAWVLSLLGAHLPWPAVLGGHGSAALITDNPLVHHLLGSGGGSGPSGGWDPASFAFTLVCLILTVCVVIGIAVCLSYSGAAWLLIRSMPLPHALTAAGEASIRGAVSGATLAVAGALMQLALTRAWRGKHESPPQNLDRKSYGHRPKELEQDLYAKRAARLSNLKYDLKNAGWFPNAIVTGALTGGLNAALYVLIVFAGAALFGIQAVPPR